MIGIPLGLLYGNACEWVLHRYVLHGLGRRKGSFFAFHWRDHHRQARLHDMRDPHYERSVFAWNAQGKEALGLVGLGVLHLPLLPVAPFFAGTLAYCMWNYYRTHKRAHMEPAWAYEHLPWHVDHHLGPNPEANWCVTRPWFDVVLGTRTPWVGTPREAEDRAQAAKRAAR